MYQLVLAILALAGVWEAYQHLLTPGGKAKLKGYLLQWFTVLVEEAQPILTAVEGELKPMVDAFVSAFHSYGNPILADLKTEFTGLTYDAFVSQAKNLTDLGESMPDQSVLTAAKALSEAYGFGLASAGVTAAFEAAFPKKLNSLNGVGAMLSQMAGFEEVSGAIRRPLYENAFGKAAEYQFRSIFKPELPDEFDAVLWHARRLLTDDQLRKVFNFSGLKPEYEEPYIKSAFRAVQPRAIASAIQDTPFPRAEMQDLLLFGGYRDQDIALLLEVFETNSVKNVRQQYLSAVVTAAERGTLTDADLDSHLTSLNFSDTAKNYVHLTVAVRRLEQLAEIYRKSVTVLYETGQLTDAQYVPALEAIGINQADAEAHFAVDSARLRGKALAAAERAAAREAARIQRLAIVTLRTQFLAGQIDVVTLTAELAAATFDPLLVAGIVANLEAQLSARRRDVAGKLVSATDAKLLTEQIAAINEQTVKKLLTPAQALQQIEALGIPAANAEALVAKWAAQADKVVLPI